MFLAIIFIGTGSTWIVGNDPHLSAYAAHAKCRKDWKDFHLPENLECLVYDISNVPGYEWHADASGVYATATKKRLKVAMSIIHRVTPSNLSKLKLSEVGSHRDNLAKLVNLQSDLRIAARCGAEDMASFIEGQVNDLAYLDHCDQIIAEMRALVSFVNGARNNEIRRS